VADDARSREVIAKVGALVTDRFRGSYRLAFKYYDADDDDVITMADLVRLLADAGVGFRMTRELWAAGVIDALDRDGDDRISWKEFEDVLHPPGPPAGR